jgi:hypothetical protein
MVDAGRAADELEGRLRALGTAERAEHERRYLKSELEHLGATVWQIRREVKAFAKEREDLSHAELVALVEALWARPVHERRMAAVFLLEANPELRGFLAAALGAAGADQGAQARRLLRPLRALRGRDARRKGVLHP